MQFSVSSWKKLLYSLKNIFSQIKWFENSFEKSSLIWQFSSWFWPKNLFDWKKSSKISLFSLIGGNPDYGLFTLPDPDSDSDSKDDGYITL